MKQREAKSQMQMKEQHEDHKVLLDEKIEHLQV